MGEQNGHYPERLASRLEEYEPDMAEYLGRVCRVGYVSYEKMLGILDKVEVEIAMRTADRVFGAIPTPEVFSDSRRLFDVDL